LPALHRFGAVAYQPAAGAITTGQALAGMPTGIRPYNPFAGTTFAEPWTDWR
jgi:hypothetical protein